MPFADLGLSDQLLRAVTDSGYDTPTPIQKGAIPSVLMGKDLIVEFRNNRYLRFRATNRNDLWVGSEKKPMDLCWAHADPGIDDFAFRAVQTRLTPGDFEVLIDGDKPSLEGKVKIGLAIGFSAKRCFANSAAGCDSAGGARRLAW